MSNLNPTQGTVRRTLLKGKKVPDGLSTLENVCSAGAQCPEVQNSPVALEALGGLQKSVANAQAAVIKKQAMAQAHLAAIAAVKLAFKAVKSALDIYQASVDNVANGDVSVINDAGLLSRDVKAPAAALTKVTTAYSKPGKHSKEAIIEWPAAPGATGYGLEVNYTPQDPSGTWTALASGSRRRRVVEGPAPGAQLLVRIRALASDGTPAEWSDPVLAIAR